MSNTRFVIGFNIVCCFFLFFHKCKGQHNWPNKLTSIENHINKKEFEQASAIINESRRSDALQPYQDLQLTIYLLAIYRSQELVEESLKLRDSILDQLSFQEGKFDRSMVYLYNLCGSIEASFPPFDLQRAESFYSKSITINTRSSAHIDPELLALTHDNLAKIKIRQRDYLKANFHAQSSYKLLRKNDRIRAINKYAILLTYASVRSHFGFLEEARGIFLEALNYYKHNSKGNEHNLATINFNLGNIYYKLQNYEDAIAFYEQSYNIYKTLYGNSDSRTLDARSRQASSFILTGEGSKGISLHHSNLANVQLNHYYDSISYADQLLELAADLIYLDELNEAEHYLEACLIVTKAYDQDHTMQSIAVSALELLVKLLIEKGQIEQADRVNTLHKDLSIKVYGSEHFGLGYAYYYEAVILWKKGALQEALQRLDKCEHIFTSNEPFFYFDPFAILEVITLKTRIYYQLWITKKERKSLDALLVYLCKADELINDFLINRYTYNFRQRLGSSISKIASLKLSVHQLNTSLFNENELYSILERAKSNVLKDYLIDNYVLSKSTNPIDKESEYEYLKRMRIFLEEEIKNIDLKTPYRSRIADSLNKVTSQLNNLSYGRSKIIPYLDTEDLISLQSHLSLNDVFLHYFMSESKLYICKITSSNLDFFVFETPDLNKLITSFITILRNPNSDIDSFQIVSSKLYDQLLGRLGKLEEHVIISPSGTLSMVPFDALICKLETYKDWRQLSYLLNKHRISYAYSGTTKVISEKYKGKKIKSVSIIAPKYSYIKDDVNRKIDSIQQNVFQPLLFADKEAHSINRIVKFKSNHKLIEVLNMNSFLKSFSSSDIVHFAGHAYADIHLPRNSFLLLNDKTEIDLLRMPDILKHTSNAELICLSACHTGDGLLVEGEGILSLARAFLLTGCRSVISTLWAVNDISSSIIMVDFYQSLYKKIPKSRALQLSKINYIKKVKDIDKAHPYYWSTFMIYGSDSPINIAPKFTIFLLLSVYLFAVVIVLTVFVWSKRQ
jgi:CHAT domain-containing protein